LNGCFLSGVSLVSVLTLAKRSAGGYVRDGWAFDGGRTVLLPVAHYLLPLLHDHFPVHHQELPPALRMIRKRVLAKAATPLMPVMPAMPLGALICPYPLCDFLKK
jgi:hypothetical protein